MSPFVFYAPSLHPEVVPVPVPPQVAFFPVGLNRGGGDIAGETARTAREIAAKALPLSPEEAVAVLSDLLRMGEEHAGDGLLRQLALLRSTAPGRFGGAQDELSDLDAFAVSGALPVSPGVPDWSAKAERNAGALSQVVRQAMEACQKVLLLVHALEERTLELAQEQKRFRKAEEALLTALGDGLEDASGEGAEFAEQDGATGSAGFPAPAVPWRVAVDAVLPFLPDGALLFTADETMALDLREAGMLQPFPEDRASVFDGWPSEIIDGLLYASLPAYRLVGRKTPLAERPWLEREVEIIAARPTGGWLKPAVGDR